MVGIRLDIENKKIAEVQVGCISKTFEQSTRITGHAQIDVSGHPSSFQAEFEHHAPFQNGLLAKL
ncbi:hypothetical protein D3C86_1672500 [compost metagenome]